MKKFTVWKYPVRDGTFAIQMPKGAKILCGQRWKEVPAIWAQVDPNAEKETRTFICMGTGHEIDYDGELRYIHTFQFMGGDRVSHLFEIIQGGKVLQLVPKDQPKDLN